MDLRDQIREHQSEALRLLAEQGIGAEQVEPLWSKFKADYFARYNPKLIAWHTENLVAHSDFSKPLVLVSPTAMRGGTQVFVYTADQPKLFARMVAALDSKKVSIYDAQIMTNKDGYAMDTFVVLEQTGAAVTSTSRIQSLKKALEQAIAQPDLVIHHKARPNKQLKAFHVPPKVTFLPSGNKQRSMVELAALDMPGLLATIGQVFAQCDINIHAAKITTIGERAEDFFMISTQQDQALSADEQAELRKVLIDHLTDATEG
jgi:[protein-PII] uridylyltransferase